MLTETYNFHLPKELIATSPKEKRDECLLMTLSGKSGEIEHKHFYDIIDYLHDGDTLVLNDTKVIPARIYAKKKNGANVEIFLLNPTAGGTKSKWKCLVKGRNIKDGDRFFVEQGKEIIEALVEKTEENTKIVSFSKTLDEKTLLEIGKIPLPPYIISERKERGEKEYTKEDELYYQNVFAKNDGSVASPTAALHFTEELLQKIQSKGVYILYITLHVGFGTFAPLKTKLITEHIMHSEFFNIPENTAKMICEKKQSGKRIVACGTTVARVLESEYSENGFKRFSGETNILIYPPYSFKCVDAMITNFHTPHSTLLAMVSAFASYQNIMKAYSEAIEKGYRFFSYGDAMFIY